LQPNQPFLTVCEEILHWIQLNRNDYDAKVQNQITNGLECTRLMSINHFKRDFEIKSDFERQVLCRMICEEKPSLKSVWSRSEDEFQTSAPQWVISLFDPKQGVTPKQMKDMIRTKKNQSTQWTADGMLFVHSLTLFFL
jgi:hypothetical protein